MEGMENMERIQSTKNEKVKNWKKLHTKKFRDLSNTYLIEGEHLVEEALKTEDVIELIIQENLNIPHNWKNVPMTIITQEISKHISTTKTPQGYFAICQKRTNEIPTKNLSRFLLLDGIQDPGNLGTIIRTADACGVDLVVLGEGTVDLYNPKVIRSAQGSHFHLPIVVGKLEEWIQRIQKDGIPVFGTALDHAVPFQKIKPPSAFALIVGNEGAGVRPEILNMTDQNLYIPIYGQSESLNVSIATGILLYYLRGVTE